MHANIFYFCVAFSFSRLSSQCQYLNVLFHAPPVPQVPLVKRRARYQMMFDTMRTALYSAEGSDQMRISIVYCYKEAAGLESKSWHDRSWLRPFASPAETLLSLLPGMNPHAAQQVLFREKLSIPQFLEMNTEQRSRVIPEMAKRQMVRATTARMRTKQKGRASETGRSFPCHLYACECSCCCTDTVVLSTSDRGLQFIPFCPPRGKA
jgi:hypothetical protein